MEDLIKKIIAVDKQARKKTAESQKQLAESKHAIEERKAELEKHYNDSVNEIIELTTEEENAKIKQLKDAIDEKFSIANQKLEESFARNKDKWVNELVKRTLEQ